MSKTYRDIDRNKREIFYKSYPDGWRNRDENFSGWRQDTCAEYAEGAKFANRAKFHNHQYVRHGGNKPKWGYEKHRKDNHIKQDRKLGEYERFHHEPYNSQRSKPYHRTPWKYRKSRHERRRHHWMGVSMLPYSNESILCKGCIHQFEPQWVNEVYHPAVNKIVWKEKPGGGSTYDIITEKKSYTVYDFINLQDCKLTTVLACVKCNLIRK